MVHPRREPHLARRLFRPMAEPHRRARDVHRFPVWCRFQRTSGREGYGSRIEDEAEELAERVFEEDDETSENEVSNRVGVDGNMDVDGPNGTEDSAKEAVRGLVDEEEVQIPVSARVSSTKPHSKRPAQSEDKRLSMEAPNVDVDFEPPSTAAVVAEMDWNVDVDFDDAKGDTTPLARDLNSGDEDDRDQERQKKRERGRRQRRNKLRRRRGD